MEPERGAFGRRRERVFELVPVVEDRVGRDDRLQGRLVDAPDSAQSFRHLRRLRVQLRLVGEILEAAAAAGRVVLARRVDARRSGLHHLERQRLGVIPLHLRYARANDVPGQPAADEDDEAVQPRDAVAAVRERLDPEVELVVEFHRRGHESRIRRRLGGADTKAVPALPAWPSYTP